MQQLRSDALPRAKPCGCICGRKTGQLETDGNSHSRIAGEVLKVEFLGSSCLAEFRVEELEGQSLHLSFSLHQLKDLGVRAGDAHPSGAAQRTDMRVSRAGKGSA